MCVYVSVCPALCLRAVSPASFRWFHSTHSDMAYNALETLLAVQCLTDPLNLHPTSDSERVINDMRLEYRTYYIEYNVLDGAVMLPRMFVDDFGHEISRFVNLIDSCENQFEVLVEKIGGNIYFARGWAAIRDFYDIRLGAWLLLMYIGAGYFGLIVQNRFHRLITPPTFAPPMRFILDKSNVAPHFVQNLAQPTHLPSYYQPESFFHIAHQKTLTYYDVSSGFLMLPYDGFGEYAFDEITTSIKLIDDCGNEWTCFLIHVTFPFKHYIIGGDWKRIVGARRLSVGRMIRIGVEQGGNSQLLHVNLDL